MLISDSTFSYGGSVLFYAGGLFMREAGGVPFYADVVLFCGAVLSLLLGGSFLCVMFFSYAVDIVFSSSSILLLGVGCGPFLYVLCRRLFVSCVGSFCVLGVLFLCRRFILCW